MHHTVNELPNSDQKKFLWQKPHSQNLTGTNKSYKPNKITKKNDNKVDIKITDIPPTMRGDYINDRQFKIDFQEQLNQFWLNKDKQLQQYYSIGFVSLHLS